MIIVEDGYPIAIRVICPYCETKFTAPLYHPKYNRAEGRALCFGDNNWRLTTCCTCPVCGDYNELLSYGPLSIIGCAESFKIDISIDGWERHDGKGFYEGHYDVYSGYYYPPGFLKNEPYL